MMLYFDRRQRTVMRMKRDVGRGMERGSGLSRAAVFGASVVLLLAAPSRLEAQGADALAPPRRAPEEGPRPPDRTPGEPPDDVELPSPEGPAPEDQPEAPGGPVPKPASGGEPASGSEPAPGPSPAGAGREGEPAAQPSGGAEAEPDGAPGAVPTPEEGARQAALDESGAMRALVVPPATYGIDPVVGEHVRHRMRVTAEAMGYVPVPEERYHAAREAVDMAYPPAPSDLWRVTWAAGAKRGLFARVWAHEGRYVIELTVASLDGEGPFFARGTSGAADLHEVTERLTRQALPSIDRWNAEQAARIARGEPLDREPATPRRERPRPGIGPAPRAPVDGEEADLRTSDPEDIARRKSEEAFEGFEEPEPEPAAEPEPEAPLRRVSLALQTEGAIGTSENVFYNHLIGARLDVRITRTVLLGAYLGYANLRGRDGRVGNVLAYGQIENRVRLTSRTDITLPLRFGFGYLPFNGPHVRLAAGVNIPLGDRIELGFDLLNPTFWVLPDETAVSFDVAAELIFRL